MKIHIRRAVVSFPSECDPAIVSELQFIYDNFIMSCLLLCWASSSSVTGLLGEIPETFLPFRTIDIQFDKPKPGLSGTLIRCKENTVTEEKFEVTFDLVWRNFRMTSDCFFFMLFCWASWLIWHLFFTLSKTTKIYKLEEFGIEIDESSCDLRNRGEKENWA